MMPVLELDSNKKVTASYLYGADGVVYRRKRVAAAHWHFDEGNGTVAHDVDGRNNGTLGDGDTANKTTVLEYSKGAAASSLTELTTSLKSPTAMRWTLSAIR